MTARGYLEAAVLQDGEARPLAQPPPEVPVSDDAPTVCIGCGATVAACACGSAERVAAYRELLCGDTRPQQMPAAAPSDSEVSSTEPTHHERLNVALRNLAACSWPWLVRLECDWNHGQLVVESGIPAHMTEAEVAAEIFRVANLGRV